MRNIRFLMTCGALAAGLAAVAAGAVPSPPPAPVHGPPRAFGLRVDSPEPPSGPRGCDMLSADLDLRLDPAARAMTGTAVLGFTAVDAALDTLHLDFVAAFALDGVERRGLAATWVREGESLHIVLAPPAEPGVADSVVVRWHGTPPAHGPFNAGLMFRTHDNGTREDRSDDVPVIASVSEPWSAHAWWPCKDVPGDKLLVSLAATVPDSLSVMANGELVAITDAEPGWRRWAWREAYPIAPYLVSVAASDYVGWDEACAPADGPPVALQFRVFPPDSAAAAHDFAPTCAMFALLTDILGPWPFPGEKYAQAEIKWIGAMEHQTATSYSQYLLTGDGYYENFIVHEMAHQWFGDSLTPAAWRDIWLNEGFARYAEALWVEHARGRGAYRDYMQRIGARTHPQLFAGDGLLGDPDPILPNLLVYDKGAWVLHALRLLLDDRAFFAFLADYTGDPTLTRGSVGRADVEAAAARATGLDLGPFFAFWLDTDEVPALDAAWDAAPGPAGAAEVTVTLTQRQPTVVPMAVPLRLVSALGSQDVTARLMQRTGEFRFAVPGPLRSVAVDPDSLVLMHRGAVPPPRLQVTGPFPNPLPAAGAAFAVTAAAAGPVTVRVHDARGRLVGRATFPASGADVAETWRWTARDDRGVLLASGVYWLDFRVPGGRVVRRAVLVH